MNLEGYSNITSDFSAGIYPEAQKVNIGSTKGAIAIDVKIVNTYPTGEKNSRFSFGNHSTSQSNNSNTKTQNKQNYTNTAAQQNTKNYNKFENSDTKTRINKENGGLKFNSFNKNNTNSANNTKNQNSTSQSNEHSSYLRDSLKEVKTLNHAEKLNAQRGSLGNIGKKRISFVQMEALRKTQITGINPNQKNGSWAAMLKQRSNAQNNCGI